MTPSRRRLLQGALALASVPAWLALPFSAAADELGELETLSAAWQRAWRDGRPLLVVIVPDDDHKWDRGHALGEWFNHGDDRMLALLDGVELVCAPFAAVRNLVPRIDGARDGEDPWFVLIARAELGVVGRAIHVQVPPLDTDLRWQDGGVEQENASIDRRIAALSAAVVPLLVPLVGDPDQLDVATRIRRVARTRARLAGAPIPGAHWAVAGGCGAVVEDDPNPVMYGCGMGYVPERSRRVVYFWAMGRM